MMKIFSVNTCQLLDKDMVLYLLQETCPSEHTIEQCLPGYTVKVFRGKSMLGIATSIKSVDQYCNRMLFTPKSSQRRWSCPCNLCLGWWLEWSRPARLGQGIYREHLSRSERTLLSIIAKRLALRKHGVGRFVRLRFFCPLSFWGWRYWHGTDNDRLRRRALRADVEGRGLPGALITLFLTLFRGEARTSGRTRSSHYTILNPV